MEEAPSLDGVAEAHELVEAVVVLGDGGVRLVGLNDDGELVVGVLASAVVSEL